MSRSRRRCAASASGKTDRAATKEGQCAPWPTGGLVRRGGRDPRHSLGPGFMVAASRGLSSALGFVSISPCTDESLGLAYKGARRGEAIGPPCPCWDADHKRGMRAHGLEGLASPVRDWFDDSFPYGPTPAQQLAWPITAAGEHLLLISPTGTGKTLAAFLAVIDRLYREYAAGSLAPGLRCVYVSPLRSLGYDIARNLANPLEGIGRRLGLSRGPVTIGVRTGDTSAYARRKLREQPPHLLITTPESLVLLLSQPVWHGHLRQVEHLIVDEVHALVPTKRGADLAVSLERCAALAERDPWRIGLSATCRTPDPVAHFLVGPSRNCRIVEAPPPEGSSIPELKIESLLRSGEAPQRGLTYRRLLRRLQRSLSEHRTTIVFANTRALTEKVTHDLRHGARSRRRQCRRTPLGARRESTSDDRGLAQGRST